MKFKKIFLLFLLIVFAVLLGIFFKKFFFDKKISDQKLSYKIFFDQNNKPPFGTIFSLKTKQGDIVASAGFVRYWNTYSGYEPGELNFFVKSQSKQKEENFVFNLLGKPSSEFKTGYSFIEDKKIIFRDMANENNFFLENGQFIKNNKINYDDKFYANGFIFGMENNTILACRDWNDKKNCLKIEVYKNTWPYVYAENNGSVLVITNYGGMLIFDGNDWCRASEGDNETYYCKNKSLDNMLKSPRGKQFYSSIFYDGKTLIGAWPTGRIYEFDGKFLKPSSFSPYLSSDNSDREAQSMNIYCGDLFVGYWPRGEIMIFDNDLKKWLNKRLFSHPLNKEPFIPYLNQQPEKKEVAFFGQRITSLVSFSDRLFATTSNLRGWDISIKDPDFLTRKEINEYGSIFSLYKPGCFSKPININNESTKITFVFKKNKILIEQDDKKIGQIKNPGFLINKDLEITVGGGFFGKFNGKLDVIN